MTLTGTIHQPKPVVSPESTVRVELTDVSMTFTSGNQQIDATRSVDLLARDGELVSIIGPSGCGKSTLLNIIAGLEQPNSGTVALDGVVTEDRLGRSAYMPQKDLLLPWRTVLDNAVLGLEVTGTPKAEARERAHALLPRFGLEEFADAWPSMLSGGMKQRTAFLRTVLTDQPVLLLDEPFGALDALTRTAMQAWLLDLWTDLGRTVIFITHDVDEAILLSDRVYVMTARPGRMLLDRTIELPRPRSTHMVTTPDFVAIKAELLQALHQAMEAGE